MRRAVEGDTVRSPVVSPPVVASFAPPSSAQRASLPMWPSSRLLWPSSRSVSTTGSSGPAGLRSERQPRRGCVGKQVGGDDQHGRARLGLGTGSEHHRRTTPRSRWSSKLSWPSTPHRCPLCAQTANHAPCSHDTGRARLRPSRLRPAGLFECRSIRLRPVRLGRKKMFRFWTIMSRQTEINNKENTGRDKQKSPCFLGENTAYVRFGVEVLMCFRCFRCFRCSGVGV